jgi:Putative beta barrel porin-7 (BBP7)
VRISPRIFCFALLSAAAFANLASAQEATSSRRGTSSVRHSERVARAAWTPTRPTTKRTVEIEPEVLESRKLKARPVNTSSVNGSTGRQGKAAPVRLVDHLETIPGHSIVSSPVIHDGYEGQIVTMPEYVVEEGEMGCDSLPGGCGCSSAACDGGCGFETACGVETPCCDGGCDSMGGNGCCSMCGELASPNAWRPCITLCLPQDGWASFEYLYWWQDGMSLPPLVTTSTTANTPRNQAGVLGAPATRTLFGGDEILDEGFDGGRLRFGVWLNHCHTWGVGAEFFQIGRENEDFSATSSGNPILARPFVNVLNDSVEESELVAFPGVVSGTVGVEAYSELQGAGFHIRHLIGCSEGCGSWLFCGCAEHYCTRNETNIGYRFLELEEGVRITEDLVSTNATDPGSFLISDSFETRNQFNGFDMAWTHRRTRGFWTFDSSIRLALGNNRQTVRINGQTTTNEPGATPSQQTRVGGLLAQRSNIGEYEQNQFAVVPEISLGLGYQLTDHIRATLGYNFIYWSNVVRPGQHISRDLNPGLLPPESTPLVGGLRPEFAFDTTDYWVQGISVGGEFRW